jgi:hypothetical protein
MWTNVVRFASKRTSVLRLPGLAGVALVPTLGPLPLVAAASTRQQGTGPAAGAYTGCG